MKTCQLIPKALILVLAALNSKIIVAMTTISSIPATGYVIRSSGSYQVSQNLVYTGKHSAITIRASDVELNFNKNNLRLIHEDAKGVQASGVSRIKIYNGTIIYRGQEQPSTDNVGINLFRTTNTHIFDFSLRNTRTGINIQEAVRAHVLDSHYINSGENSSATGISIRSSKMTTISDCTINGSINTSQPDSGSIVGININPGGASSPSRTITISNCQFPGIDTAIHSFAANGLLINNCTIRGSQLAATPLIQLGSPGVGTHETIIQDCTLSKPNTLEAYSGIFLEQGSGCLISNTVVGTNADTAIASQRGAAIRIGRRESTSFRNVTIRDCIAQGKNQYGILSEGCTGLVLERCTIKQARIANILLENTRDSLITETLISEGEKDGIICSTDVKNNNIINNTISKNSGLGISLEANSSGNLVKNNNIFGNDRGIREVGTNQIFINNSCSNTNLDCIGITPTLIGTPGTTPVTLGQNICCTS